MKWFVFLMSLVVVCMPSQAQTIAAATPWVNPQFLDCSGTACVPLNGGNLYTYVSNTTTPQDRKSTRLNSSHIPLSRMPSSA